MPHFLKRGGVVGAFRYIRVIDYRVIVIRKMNVNTGKGNRREIKSLLEKEKLTTIDKVNYEVFLSNIRF